MCQRGAVLPSILVNLMGRTMSVATSKLVTRQRTTVLPSRVSVSPIHLAHPASAQRGDDFIRPEFLARGEGHPRAIIVPTKRFQLSPSSAQANSRGVTTSQSTPPVSGDRRFPGSGG